MMTAINMNIKMWML